MSPGWVAFCVAAVLVACAGLSVAIAFGIGALAGMYQLPRFRYHRRTGASPRSDGSVPYVPSSVDLLWVPCQACHNEDSDGCRACLGMGGTWKKPAGRT